MSFLRGLLAGAVGTVFMNLSSETEMKVSGRGASKTPGVFVNKMLQKVGGPRLTEKQTDIAATWVHYAYGTMLGSLLWVYREKIGLPLTAAAFGVLMTAWLAEQVELPAADISGPVWESGKKAMLTDIGHHAAYAAGAAVAWRLIGTSAANEKRNGTVAVVPSL